MIRSSASLFELTVCVCVCETNRQSCGSCLLTNTVFCGRGVTTCWRVIMTNVQVKNGGGNSIRCVSRRVSSSVRGLDDRVPSVQSGL